MDDQYKTFLKILRPVSRYAIDLTLAEMHDAPDEDGDPDAEWDCLAENKPPESFNIGRNEFLNSLYQPRGDEDVVLNFMKTSKDLICLVGPKGCGKTSMGYKIHQTLSDSSLYNYYVAFLDVRVLTNLCNLDLYNKDAFREAVLEEIKSNYMFNLFDYKNDKNGENPEVKLWAYILHRSEHMSSQLFSSFWKVQNKAAQLFSAYQKQDWQARETASYYDWLMATHNVEPEVMILTDQLREMIKIPHLIYAARAIYKYSKQFIWFDNIDAIPDGLQSETVSILKRNHGLVSDYVGTVIAVREENVFRMHDIEYSAPPHITRVNIDIERNDKGNAIYREVDAGHPAIGVPVIKKGVLVNIVNNRLEFTRNFQRLKCETIDLMIQNETERLSILTDPQQKSKIQHRIEELTKEQLFYSPLISNDCYNYIKELSNKMLDILDQEKVIHLANNSLRDFLMIYRDFLAVLLKGSAPKEIRPLALDYEPRHIITLFLRWIRTTPRKFRIATYDIIEETEKWYSNKKRGVGCILHHLVITTIWNLTVDNVVDLGGKKLYLNPTVGEVVYCLSSLGFERQEILKTILALHRHEYSSPHVHEALYGQVIEFRSTKFINSLNDIEDDHIVYVTYRGKCFVGLTSNTFGYLYECIRCYNEKTKDKGKSKKQRDPYKPQSSLVYVEEIIRPLCDIAQMHYETFQRLRDDAYKGNKEWFVNYCSWFGIPRIPPYKRGRDIGIQVKEIKRVLQFQALIDGVISYFRKEPGTDKLEKLQNLFMNAVNRLSDFQDAPSDVVNFRDQLGLEPREN